MNSFVITAPDRCIGCNACEVACSLAHPISTGGKDDLSAITFTPRLRVVKGPRLTSTMQCRHCDNAPCVNVCPTNALVYDRNTVQLVEERCIGCKSCAIACPFGVMEMVSVPVKQPSFGIGIADSFMTLAHKCDLCVDVAGGPACIPVCPTKAITLVETESLAKENAKKRERYVLSQLPDVSR